MTTGRPAKRPRANGGMTLLELVLVMVIICTVLGAASPSLRGFFTARRTQDAAGQILSLTRLAYSRAITEGVVVRLNFDQSGNTYYLTAQQGATFERQLTGLGRPFLLPDGVSVELTVPGAEQERDYVDFLPDGRSEPCTIRLTDIKGNVVRVTCEAPTEQFTVQEGEETP